MLNDEQIFSGMLLAAFTAAVAAASAMTPAPGPIRHLMQNGQPCQYVIDRNKDVGTILAIVLEPEITIQVDHEKWIASTHSEKVAIGEAANCLSNNPLINPRASYVVSADATEGIVLGPTWMQN